MNHLFRIRISLQVSQKYRILLHKLVGRLQNVQISRRLQMRRERRQSQTQDAVSLARRFDLIRVACQNAFEFGRVTVGRPEEVHTVQYQLATIIQIKLNQPTKIICTVQQRVKIKRERVILLAQLRLGIEGFITPASLCK